MKAKNKRNLCVHWIAVVALFGGTTFVGCATEEVVKNEPTTTIANDLDKGPARARNKRISDAGYTVKEFDLNKDGRADQRHLSASGSVERIERDLNFDGRYDSYEYYAGGRLVEEEFDLDLDGTIDVVRVFQGGAIAQKRYATGFRADLVISRFYDASGALIKVERDTNDDGQINVWEYYRPGESTPWKVEVDENLDGRPDTTTTS